VLLTEPRGNWEQLAKLLCHALLPLAAARLVCPPYLQNRDVHGVAQVGSILRHSEDSAWRCDTAQRMRSEWYQRYAGLGGERVRDQDNLVERPA
jgi:hypothetical protein